MSEEKSHEHCSAGTGVAALQEVVRVICEYDGGKCDCPPDGQCCSEDTKIARALLSKFDIRSELQPSAATEQAKPSNYWTCCHCDAPLSCAACGVEQPDDSEHYRKLQEENDRLRAVPQEVPHPDETVNFNGRLVTWAEIDAAVRKRNAAIDAPKVRINV